VLPVESSFIKQLDNVTSGVEVDALKIGMLGTSEIVHMVKQYLVEKRPKFVVLDPVYGFNKWGGGDRLLNEEAEVALSELFGLVVDLITPNLLELAVLTSSLRAQTLEEMIAQASALAKQQKVMVLAKRALPECRCRTRRSG
jgi:hydroxymethylpyrimidine/phosphomethylpyrimidine kinase